MSKYRLCYRKWGQIVPVELEKLECLKDKKTTDIKIIDIFTMQFKDMDVLLDYLKQNNLVDNFVTELFITVDKKDKETGLKIDKKIYNGDILLFSDYRDSYNGSTVANSILNNKYNYNFIIKVCDNYLEKYQNAYDRITGASFILSTLNTIRTLALRMKDTNYEMNLVEMQSYNQCLNDFVNMEFWKIDKEYLKQTGKIRKKLDKDGFIKQNYRNIHDYITLLLSFKKKKKEDKVEVKEEFIEDLYEHEEFLTEEDIKRATKEIVENYTESNFGYQDGHDWVAPTPKEEIEDSLIQSGKKLCLKPGDGGYLY